MIKKGTMVKMVSVGHCDCPTCRINVGKHGKLDHDVFGDETYTTVTMANGFGFDCDPEGLIILEMENV